MAQEKRFSFSAIKMGSPFHIVMYTQDSMKASRLALASFQLVDSLNNVFSDYMAGSELNRLCATAGKGASVEVSAPFYELLLKSEVAWRVTKGKFDITSGPLTHLWRKARRGKYFPIADSVDVAKNKVGFQNISINKVSRQVTMLKEGMQLDAGGIAAGYIAEKVLELLGQEGVTSALVDASGDIVCSKPPPAKEGWMIGVNLPGEGKRLGTQTILLHNKSVSTSGDVFQYLEHKGKRYSHILNPKTGYGVTFQRNVTIIAPDGTDADWLATVCSILPLKKVRRLVKKFHGEFLITQMKEGRLLSYYSKDFANYWDKND